MPLTIGVPTETAPGERRAALVPDAVARLVKAGAEVVVQSGAGQQAYVPDAAYEAAGARIGARGDAWGAEVVARVQGPAAEDLPLLGAGRTLIGFLRPLDDPRGMAALAATGATALAMELVPRTTRAQKMDALSAMATVAGYRAVLLAAEALPKFFPLLTTAAGTVRPAKVLVLGAGVAGLQAIATARRLGAVVSAYDVRAAAAEEARSLGATFVQLELDTVGAEGGGGYAAALDEQRQRRQVELLAEHVAASDVVITTALIPGRPAPLLVSEEGVRRMAPGSVVVDLAAPNGGNCALTRPGEVFDAGGVRVFGPLNLPAEMPLNASQMYARTLSAMILEWIRDGAFAPPPDDDIFRAACVARGGEVVNDRVRAMLHPAPA
ncbi:MAG TPA: Re/Si-specific NAD(P)(+) transhydrogenase subunit alpha [Longimicrobium sp.]|jgi:NAD(P) transhydrogenase subunit alpha|uniref:Re/Si-specific NAD(P)(+) transhydrogenase subunit alpha n=1 Tax=Longimicrobium sp. TaxID=2029185 RepID=UPI002ED9A235